MSFVLIIVGAKMMVMQEFRVMNRSRREDGFLLEMDEAKLRRQTKAKQDILESLVQLITILAKPSVRAGSKTTFSSVEVFTQKIAKWSELLTNEKEGVRFSLKPSDALDYMLSFAFNGAQNEILCEDLVHPSNAQVYCLVCRKDFLSENSHYDVSLAPYLEHIFGESLLNGKTKAPSVYQLLHSKLCVKWKATVFADRENVEKEKILWGSEDWRVLHPFVTTRIENMMDQILAYDIAPHLTYINHSVKLCSKPLELVKYKPGKCNFVDPMGIKLSKCRETFKMDITEETITVNLRSIKLDDLIDQESVGAEIDPPSYIIGEVAVLQSYGAGARCACCNDTLSVLKRNRHHCHDCGKCICSKCRNACPLLGQGFNTPKGVCAKCFRLVMCNHALIWATASINMLEKDVPPVAEIYFDVSVAFIRYEKSKSEGYRVPLSPYDWDKFKPYDQLVELAMEKNNCKFVMKVLKLSTSVIDDLSHCNRVWRNAVIMFAKAKKYDFLLNCLAEINAPDDEVFWTNLARDICTTNPEYHKAVFFCLHKAKLGVSRWIEHARFFDSTAFAICVRHATYWNESKIKIAEKSLSIYTTYCVSKILEYLTATFLNEPDLSDPPCVDIIGRFFHSGHVRLALLTAYLALEKGIVTRVQLLKVCERYMPPAASAHGEMSESAMAFIIFVAKLFQTQEVATSLRENLSFKNVYFESLFNSLVSKQLGSSVPMEQLLSSYLTDRNVEGMIAGQTLLLRFFPSVSSRKEFSTESQLITAMIVHKILILQKKVSKTEEDLWFKLGIEAQKLNPERAYICFVNSSLSLDEKIGHFLAEGLHDTLIDFLLRHKQMETILEIGTHLIRRGEEERRNSHLYFSSVTQFLESSKTDDWNYIVESLCILFTELFFDDENTLRECLCASLACYPRALDDEVAHVIHSTAVKILMRPMKDVKENLNRVRCLQGANHFRLGLEWTKKIEEEMATVVQKELQKALVFTNFKALGLILEFIVWQHGADLAAKKFFEQEFHGDVRRVDTWILKIFGWLLLSAIKIAKGKYTTGMTFLYEALYITAHHCSSRQEREQIFACVSILVCQPLHYEGLMMTVCREWRKQKSSEEKENFLRKYSWLFPCCDEEQTLVAGRIVAPGIRGCVRRKRPETVLKYPPSLKESCKTVSMRCLKFLVKSTALSQRYEVSSDDDEGDGPDFVDAQEGRAQPGE